MNYFWLWQESREGNGNPLQYSCLDNPMDRGAWRATVQGVARSWTRLSDETTTTMAGVILDRIAPICNLLKQLSVPWFRMRFLTCKMQTGYQPMVANGVNGKHSKIIK